jgi:DNA polymerase III subunit alpha
VLGPDVNRSQAGFEIEALPGERPAGVKFDRGIRFGLAAIKNVGEGPVHALINERAAGGPFQTIEDLCARVDRHAINKRLVESLVKAGALDSLPGTRRQKLAILDQAVSAGAEAQKAREIGQSSLFDMLGEPGGPAALNVPRIPMPIIQETPAEKKEELLWEKELLGVNLSDDPVARAIEGVDLTGVSSLSDITEEHIGETLTFVGVLSGVRRIATKKGDTMLVANLEDLTGTIELVVFPKLFAKSGDLLRDDAAVKLTAKVDNRRDTTQLVVETVEAVEQGELPPPVAMASEMDLEGVGELLDAPPAPVPALTAPPAAPISMPRAKSQVKVGNGNGNGKADAPRESQRVHGGSLMSESAPISGRMLRLYLPRTGDDEADVRRMQEVYSILRDSSGPDRVTLYLPNGVGIVVLQSQHTVNLSAGLLTGLERLLGTGRVVAE